MEPRLLPSRGTGKGPRLLEPRASPEAEASLPLPPGCRPRLLEPRASPEALEEAGCQRRLTADWSPGLRPAVRLSAAAGGEGEG